jgi:Bacteriophage probable baseplate hub protein
MPSAIADRRQPLVPSFAVKLNDKPLANDIGLWIVSVVVEDELNYPSMFTLQLISKEDERGTDAWTDDPRLQLGARVELSMGYAGAALDTLISGEITGLEPTFSVGGPPTLVVRGYDRRNRLNGVRRYRRFPKAKDSDIARQVCKDLVDIEPTDSRVEHDGIVQKQQTDLDFLIDRASHSGFELAMTGTKLLFRPIANKTPAVATLKLSDDLLEFRPRLSLQPVTEVVSVAWDPKQKAPIIASATADSIAAMDDKKLGAKVAAGVIGGAVEKLPGTPVASQAEANQLAVGKLTSAALKYIKADGTARGRTDLRAGTVIELKGLGKTFDGSYYIKSAVHRYSSRAGYLTDFQAERNAS